MLAYRDGKPVLAVISVQLQKNELEQCFWTAVPWHFEPQCVSTRLTLWIPAVAIYTTCFNILKLCILPTECICVFYMVFEMKRDCFPEQHEWAEFSSGDVFPVRCELNSYISFLKKFVI
jgi:hypothetical protein